MGLKTVQVPETTVKFTGGEVVVRGLSLTDIIALARQYGPTMAAGFEQAQAAAAAGNGFDLGAIGKDLLATAPELVAAVIAYGAGEPDEMEMAKKLPAPVQLECLEAIGAHTVATEGGLKKVVETVIRVAQATTGALTSLQA
jgi:hypothetical protein